MDRWMDRWMDDYSLGEFEPNIQFGRYPHSFIAKSKGTDILHVFLHKVVATMQLCNYSMIAERTNIEYKRKI